MDENLRETWFKELLEFLHCPLHIMHNAFRKLITSLGETAGQLAFDFHAWFKVSVDKYVDYFSNMLKELSTIETSLHEMEGKDSLVTDGCFYALKKSFFVVEKL